MSKCSNCNWSITEGCLLESSRALEHKKVHDAVFHDRCDHFATHLEVWAYKQQGKDWLIENGLDHLLNSPKQNQLKVESTPAFVVHKPTSDSVQVKYGHWTSIFYPLIANPLLTGLIGGILVYIALSAIAVALGLV